MFPVRILLMVDLCLPDGRPSNICRHGWCFWIVPRFARKNDCDGYFNRFIPILAYRFFTGNQKISQIAAVLSINHAVVENSQGWFRLSLQHNFLQGRHTDHVVACCMYIACRKSKTPHLLIDFSEVLQVFTNVSCSRSV